MDAFFLDIASRTPTLKRRSITLFLPRSTAEGDYREVMIDIKKDLKGDDLDDDLDDRGAAADGAPLPKAGDDDGLVAGVLNFLACGSAEDATGRKNSACLDAPEPPVAHL